jgi:hypothetical protein
MNWKVFGSGLGLLEVKSLFSWRGWEESAMCNKEASSTMTYSLPQCIPRETLIYVVLNASSVHEHMMLTLNPILEFNLWCSHVLLYVARMRRFRCSREMDDVISERPKVMKRVTGRTLIRAAFLVPWQVSVTHITDPVLVLIDWSILGLLDD